MLDFCQFGKWMVLDFSGWGLAGDIISEFLGRAGFCSFINSVLRCR